MTSPTPGGRPREDLHSPVPHLLDTGADASPIEARLIRDFLAQVEGQIIDINLELEQMKIKLIQLLQERIGLTYLAAKHQELFFPIRKLSPEIMAKIFIECLPSRPCGWRHPHPWHYPLLVAQINQSWRKVALTTPGLWVNLHLNLQSHTFQSTLNLVQTFILRSGNHPLFISLNQQEKILDSSPLLTLLFDQSDRWRSLKFCLPISRFKILSPARGRLSALTSLGISAPDSITLPGRLSCFDIFEVAPRLRDVNICGDFSPRAIALPWAQLSAWSNDYALFAISDCIALFNRAPGLLTFTGRLSDTDAYPIPVDMTSCALPFLTSLDLTLKKQNDISLFLKLVDLPSIKALSLTMLNTFLDSRWPQDACIAFLERSQFLRSLTIRHARFLHHDISEFLCHTPLLTDLHLESELPHLIDDLLIKSLTCGHDHNASANLVPNLKSIGFKGRIQCSDMSLISMILSRRTTTPQDAFGFGCLESVYVEPYACYQLDSSFIARLRCLENQGLKITPERYCS